LRPLFCSPVHVLSSVSVEGVLTETKRNAAMATANQVSFVAHYCDLHGVLF
jgi:hypothetical protein